jgi:hypothetical protein
MFIEYLLVSLIVLVLVFYFLRELRKYIHSSNVLSEEPSYIKSDIISYPFYVIGKNSLYFSDKLGTFCIRPDYKISSPKMLNEIFGNAKIQIISEQDVGICLYIEKENKGIYNTLNFKNDFTIYSADYILRGKADFIINLIMNHEVIQEQQKQKNLGIR